MTVQLVITLLTQLLIVILPVKDLIANGFALEALLLLLPLVFQIVGMGLKLDTRLVMQGLFQNA